MSNVEMTYMHDKLGPLTAPPQTFSEKQRDEAERHREELIASNKVIHEALRIRTEQRDALLAVCHDLAESLAKEIGLELEECNGSYFTKYRNTIAAVESGKVPS